MNATQNTRTVFLTRKQYDRMTDDARELLTDLIEACPNRRWSLAGCAYYNSPSGLADNVTLIISQQ